MIQTVVKRDGRIVGFNEQKIMAAMVILDNYLLNKTIKL